MPLTLLAVLWMAWLRSGRSEQARFARVAAALRSENAALGESMRSLGQRLADARSQAMGAPMPRPRPTHTWTLRRSSGSRARSPGGRAHCGKIGRAHV